MPLRKVDKGKRGRCVMISTPSGSSRYKQHVFFLVFQPRRVHYPHGEIKDQQKGDNGAAGLFDWVFYAVYFASGDFQDQELEMKMQWTVSVVVNLCGFLPDAVPARSPKCPSPQKERQPTGTRLSLSIQGTTKIRCRTRLRAVRPAAYCRQMRPLPRAV